MKIAVIGASGNAGSRITAELARRGHQVTAIARNPDRIASQAHVTATKGDVTRTTITDEQGAYRLSDLEDGPWRSRIAERKAAGVNRWRGDTEARRAVYDNRARLRSGAAKEAFRLRAELVERSFALTLDRGGMRRAWLRGGENLKKRYLVHVAGYNLGLIMRLLVGAGTPREFLARVSAHLLLLTTADDAAAAILVVATGIEAAMLVVSIQPEPHDGSRVSSTGC